MKQACQVFVATLLLAIWVPATLHCQLKSLPGLEALLSCCAHADADSAHHEGDCDMDGCRTVEAGFYKLRQAAPILPPPPSVAWLAVFSLPSCLENANMTVPAAPPRLLPTVWQFTQRAAPPARAPSLAA